MSYRSNHHIGVIGAGTMGRGIVQLLAQAGHLVYCFDAMEGAAANAVQFVTAKIERSVEKGNVRADQFEAIRSRIQVCSAFAELADRKSVV